MKSAGRGVRRPPAEAALVHQSAAPRGGSNGAGAASGGAGLGLAICRAIVEAHQGRIWIAPQEAGQGATVCFMLPVETQPALPEE